MGFKSKRVFGRAAGFTIIETAMSLLLVLLAGVLGARMVISALDGYKKSKIAFTQLREMESFKDRLLAKPFDSAEWKDGSYKKESGPFNIEWEIKNISATLKAVYISIVYKYNGSTKRSYFYKSKYINSQN